MQSESMSAHVSVLTVTSSRQATLRFFIDSIYILIDITEGMWHNNNILRSIYVYTIYGSSLTYILHSHHFSSDLLKQRCR